MTAEPQVVTEQHLFTQDPTTTAPRCTCGELYRAAAHCPGVDERGHGQTASTVHWGCCPESR